MPELETPNFPKGKYPRLSPNPNDPGLELKNGGQETPVIIGTEPQTQGKYDNEQDAKIAALEHDVAELKAKDVALEAKFADYYTKEETNNAISTAITGAINTAY